MIVFRILGCAVFGLVCVSPFNALAQDDEAIPQSDQTVREFTQKAAASYDLQSNQKSLELNRTPVLGWTNPVRKSKHGSVFVWTNQGRPEVIACMYFDTKTGWRHEFKSITTASKVQAMQGTEAIWSATEPGVKWEAIDDMDSVSSSVSMRLAQMRRIAKTFSGSFDDLGQAEELRLLSQPIFRYESTESGVVDGAIFCLAQGTNPEILLILEGTDSKTQPWRYAVARMTGYPCKASRNGLVIWECGRSSMGGPGSTT